MAEESGGIRGPERAVESRGSSGFSSVKSEPSGLTVAGCTPTSSQAPQTSLLPSGANRSQETARMGGLGFGSICCSFDPSGLIVKALGTPSGLQRLNEIFPFAAVELAPAGEPTATIPKDNAIPMISCQVHLIRYLPRSVSPGRRILVEVSIRWVSISLHPSAWGLCVLADQALSRTSSTRVAASRSGGTNHRSFRSAASPRAADRPCWGWGPPGPMSDGTPGGQPSTRSSTPGSRATTWSVPAPARSRRPLPGPDLWCGSTWVLIPHSFRSTGRLPASSRRVP